MLTFALSIALICGILGGVGSALIVYFSGYGLFLAFLAYSFGGAFCLVLTAALLARFGRAEAPDDSGL